MGLLTKVNWVSAIIIWFIVTNTILEPFAKMNQQKYSQNTVSTIKIIRYIMIY
jgi:hypothetical protein